MTRLIFIFLLLTNVVFAQPNEKIQDDFVNEYAMKPENVLAQYSAFDFSNIWTQTKNYNILGIIGLEHQRLKIKLISVEKHPNDPNAYFVYGKSWVKGIICEFNGKINLTEIKETKTLHFGVDDEYSDKGIKSQGILIATYEFKENLKQRNSGILKGKLYTKWYLDANHQIQYDDIEFFSDGYTNNAFIGIWKSYPSGEEKVCNWGDYRVPNANDDFDIGAGEFSPNEKYFNKGWSDYNEMESEPWWK